MAVNKIINLRDAQVSTATIEIRTLTVSNKQVTLAVFRQLIEETLINDQGSLNGVPWGIVNYHPDKCADDPPHVHVVWQRGNELRRAYIDLNPFKYQRMDTPEITLAGELAARDFMMGRIDTYQVELPWMRQVTMAKSDNFNNCIKYYKQYVSMLWDDDYSLKDHNVHYFPDKADLINEYVDNVNKLDPRTLDEYWLEVVDSIKREIERRERWRQQILNLQTLPQLFIAV